MPGPSSRPPRRKNKPKHRGGEQQAKLEERRAKESEAKKVWAETEAVDRTLSVGDVSDRLLTDRFKAKHPPRRVRHPGGDALTLLKPQPPPVRDEITRALRHNAALRAPVSPAARKTLRQSRDPSLPDKFTPQPGKLERERKSRWERFTDYGVGDALGDIYSGADWVGYEIFTREEREAILKEIVEPALQDSMAAGEYVGRGLDYAAEKTKSAVGDLLPDSGGPKTGAWAGRSESAQELAGVASVPAEVASHTAKVLRNTLVGGSQIALGIGPGLVYTMLEPEAMARATAEQYRVYYGPLLEGDFHKFLKNVEDFPLQVPLDLVAVLQVIAGGLARAGAVAQNMRYVGDTLVIRNPVTGKESPATRRQAVLHGVFTRRTPVDPLNNGQYVWGQPRHIRYIEKEQRVPVATENSKLQLVGVDPPHKRIGGGVLPRVSAKKAGQVGLRAVTGDNRMPEIEWQGQRWLVEGIFEKVPVAQRFAPRSDVGRMLTDLYWKMRPERAGYRQAKRNEIEIARAIGFQKVQAARTATKWLDQGILRRVPPKERRARQHAFTQLFVFGDDQGLPMTLQEIAKIESDPKLHTTAPQRERLQDLKRALPLIENQPRELARALAAVRPLAEKTESLLIRMGYLKPETAKQMIRSNFAWLADETPLDNTIRSQIEEALLAVTEDPGEVALAMQAMDNAARSWAAGGGERPAPPRLLMRSDPEFWGGELPPGMKLPSGGPRVPADWYSETFGGARVASEAELMLLSPQTAREGVILVHSEGEAARIAAAEAAGIVYPQARELRGQGGVAAWDSARSRAYSEGEALDLTPVGELVAAGYRLYGSEDGTVGFSIGPAGDLGHLFSTSNVRGATRSAILHAVEEGATHTDTLDAATANLLRQYGFEEIARTKFDKDLVPEGWQGGEPDIIHMGFSPWFGRRPPRYVSYEEGQRLAASAAIGSEGRALFRTFYTQTVKAIEQFPERIKMESFVPRLRRAGVKEYEIEYLRIPEFVAQFKGTDRLGKEELLGQFTEKERFPVAVFREDDVVEGLDDFESYTLPGGREEYATMAIYWPRRFTEDEMLNWSRTPEGQAAEAAADRARLARENWDDDWPRDEEGNILLDEEEDLSFDDRYEPEYEDLDQPPPEIYVYQDPHYTDFRGANMLAHARLTIRTIDAKKTLLIEELQSELFNRLRKGHPAPSDAPLANAWKARMLKEVLAYAVDNNIDRIAWVKGRQHAAFYDKALYENVSKIEVSRKWHVGEEMGWYVYETKLYGKNGELQDTIPDMDKFDFRSLLGETMAMKAIDDLDAGSDIAVLEGDNLTIGFRAASIYDRDIPGFFAKYLKKHGVKLSQGIVDKIPQTFRYHDGRWHGRLGGTVDAHDPDVDHGWRLPEVEISSASREALRFAIRTQEKPADVVHTPDGWAIEYPTGIRSEVFDSEAAAVRQLDNEFAVLNDAGDVRPFRVSPDDEYTTLRQQPEEEVPYIDLTPEAIKMIQEGQTNFRMRKGVPVAALYKPNVGNPLMLFTERAGFIEAMHEMAHAALPEVGKSLQRMGDSRHTAFQEHFGIKDWDDIPVDAHEAVAAAVELLLYNGDSPYPHMRDFMQAASNVMHRTVAHGAKQLIPDEVVRAKAEGALANPDVATVLHDIFDYGRGTMPSPDAQFITRHRAYGLARTGQRLRTFPKAGLSSMPKPPVKGKAKMTAVKEALYLPGADPALAYAAEAVRVEMAQEGARWVTEQAVPIPIHNSVPQVPRDMAFWRPGETHTTIEQFNAMVKRGDEQGINIPDLEPVEMAEYISSIVDNAAHAQTGGRAVGQFLPDWATFLKVTGLSDEAALAEIRAGKIMMAPKQSINTYLDAVSGAWSLERLDGALAALRTFLSIPNMLAKWRMITKPSYTVLNAANAEILGILHQGIWHPFNLRVVSDIASSYPVEVLHYFDALVGGGTAELGRLSDVRPRGAIDAMLKGEQAVFHKALNFMSLPERRLRRTAAIHEFRRYGLTRHEDIAEFARRAETDPKLKAIEADIARAAEESMIRFRGMRPAEQALVRNFLFVYGWIRAATRFTLRYPLEHPILARMFTWMGDYGWDEVRKKFHAVPWRYAGGIPTDISEEDYRAYIEMFDLNPVLPQATAAEFARAVWNSGTDWDVAKDTLSDLLAPGAEIGLSAIFGEDNWNRSFMEQLRENYLDWRYYPGLMWINRFMDPTATETKLRAPGDRIDVAAMFVVGGSALTTYKAEALYQRWLEDLPIPIKRIIQHQQDAANMRLVADKAFEEMGGLPNSMALAIMAHEAYEVGNSYMLSRLQAEQKKEDPHVPDDEKITTVSDAWKSGIRLRVMKKIFPDAATEIEQQIKDFGYDPSNQLDYAGISNLIDGRWDSLVTGMMSSIRAQLKSKGIPEPRSTAYYWGAGDAVSSLWEAYDQEWEK